MPLFEVAATSKFFLIFLTPNLCNEYPQIFPLTPKNSLSNFIDVNPISTLLSIFFPLAHISPSKTFTTACIPPQIPKMGFSKSLIHKNLFNSVHDEQYSKSLREVPQIIILSALCKSALEIFE